MQFLAEAIDTLKAAERAIREQLTNAASAGEYDDVVVLGEWARQLSSLLNTAAQTAAPSPANEARRVTPSSPAQRARSDRAARRQAYPKFFRDGDALLKVGWSKAERTEYEHRAPKSALIAFVAQISRLGAGGKRFAMEQLLPLRNSNGTDLPTYQAYLCLAWLRSIGLVTQHGRRGYSIRKGCDLQSGIEEVWRKMPQK